MTTWDSFDPRRAIRTFITTEADIVGDGTTQRIITIQDNAGNYYQIPIYLSEESKSDVIPPLPLIELGLLDVHAKPQDIGASTRKIEARIDINIYWQKMDNIDQDIFGKLISDKLYNLIRNNQCTILGTDTFINVERTGRVWIETYGKQVVYHKNMELYVLYYDRP